MRDWIGEHTPELGFGLGLITIVVIIAASIVFGSHTPQMYVRGYVPQETGERVTCVYDKKWINTGTPKKPSGYYQHNLYCTPSN